MTEQGRNSKVALKNFLFLGLIIQMDFMDLLAIKRVGSYEKLYSMVRNKIATERSVFGLCALTTIPERTNVGDGPGGEQGTSVTPPKPLRRREGHRAANNGLEGYYR